MKIDYDLDELVEKEIIMNTQEKVIEGLKKLGTKFNSAFLLIEAIERFGLFEGIATYYRENDWDFEPWDYSHDIPIALHNILEDGKTQVFRCFKFDDNWVCMLSSGNHYLKLVFNLRMGDFEFIMPDLYKSENFWQSEAEMDRIKEICSLLYPE